MLFCRKKRDKLKSRKIIVEAVKKISATPIAELVQVACRYDSGIHIQSGTSNANAKSIMGMMALNFSEGQELTVIADGADEEIAIAGIESFLTGKAVS
ncbi:MAG: HPr family phosphocarrier protein [Lachnospiraceae bacterium]|nr:HPr family phosphocarrier protein [Lachnospiraceae bacterium]